MGDKTDELVLDFSWLSNIFSGKKKGIKEKEQKKYLRVAVTIFLLMIPLALSFHIRSLPNRLDITKEWARNGVVNYVTNQVTAQINSQYPNLPAANKQPLINEEVNRQLSQMGNQLDQIIDQNAEGFKAQFKDESGETYLGDIDSYFWLRYTRNIVETGQYGDAVVEGEIYDMRMSAPTGRPATVNLYPYIEAWLYRFMNFFNPNFSLMAAAYYTPMLLSFIAIIAAFFIGKKLSGNIAGLVASVLVAVNPTALSRSLGSDNDIVNVVFPLVIMLFVFYAYDSKKYRTTALFAAITGFLIGFYSFAWSGWWFMFLFIIGAGIAYIGYTVARDMLKQRDFRKNLITQNAALLLVVFLVSSFISLQLFGQGKQFFNVFRSLGSVITIKAASHGISLWPNVYTTVAELNSANMAQIIGSLGGRIALVLALLGTIFTLAKFNSKRTVSSAIYLAVSLVYFMVFVDLARSNTINLIVLLAMLTLPLIAGLLLSIVFDYELDPIHSLLMTIWFIATIYASTKGVRFILLIVPAYVVSFSVLMGESVKKLSGYLSRSLDMHELVPKSIGIVVVAIILIQPIQGGIRTAYNYVPSVNDGWVSALSKIRLESQPDAIINSWWDFGHWFKYWADKQVTFDGASQNKQQAHWIGKVLLTGDEDQAVAILRMLDCGGTAAESELYDIFGDTQKSVEYTYTLFELDRIEAEQNLLKITDQEKTNNILDAMYCEPPENYFITSGDLVGKSGVWAHFGSWNFERAMIYEYFTQYELAEFISTLNTEMQYSEEDAQRIFYELSSKSTDREINDWIAPWPSYGGYVSCSRIDNSSLLCSLPNIPILINTSSNEAYVETNELTYYPNTFTYVEEGEFIVKDYTENEIGYSIALLPNNQVIFMSPELAESMFTRLFFYDGAGLEKFNKFHDITDVTGSRIITWLVDWEK